MRLKTHDEFIAQMHEKNPDVQILSQYQKDAIKVKCRCLKCGYEWDVTPSNLLSGKGCKMCNYQRMRQDRMKPHSQFIDEMHVIHPELIVLSVYDGNDQKVKCKCKIHNCTGEMRAGHLLRGKTFCKECYKQKNFQNTKKTNLEFITELSFINPYIYPMEKYNGAKNKIKVQCRKCGAIWYADPSYLVSGNCHCTSCSRDYSKGESCIRNYLIQYDIKHITHKSFDGLKGVGGKALTYDFYIQGTNILIEFQGAFHDGTAKFLNKDYYPIQQEHDRRKKEYAFQHQYVLHEIWYYQNINVELDKIFNKNPVEITV